MARFYGEIGYGESVEVPADSGIWKDVITEFPYYGDVVRNIRRLEDGKSVNDDVTIGNSISIVADEYAVKHIHTIRYIRWRGINWKVTSVEVRAPRLILSIGDVYNGPVAESVVEPEP